MSNIQKAIKNVKSFGKVRAPIASNNPGAIAGREKQFFATETKTFVSEYAQYASDYFSAQVQGINADNFFEYVPCMIRMADIVSPTPTAHVIENWKMVYFQNPSIDWIGMGAKILVGDGLYQQTYIVVNPSNISSATPNCIVRRCNVAWNYLDYYGNTVTEPFAWEKPGALSTADWASEYMINAGSYQHSVMQLNTLSSALNNNIRMILGKSAYFVRGLVDFTREFSANAASVHIQHFDLERVEPLETDDLVNGIAGGNAFSWQIQVVGANSINVGATSQLSALSTRNGEAVASTTEYPIAYTWSTSDKDVCTVSAAGLITGIAAGNATITCALTQNPNIMQTFAVSVVSTAANDYVAFLGNVPAQIAQFASATFYAAFFHNGGETAIPVTFSVSTAISDAYTATANGNALTIDCWLPTDEPIVITASASGTSASVSVELVGY